MNSTNEQTAETHPQTAAPRKPLTNRSLRFSMRTLICGFATIAVISGLIGRTSTTYLLEKRVANRIEALGGQVSMATIAPDNIVDRLLFRAGVTSVFNRIVNVRISGRPEAYSREPPIRMKDEVAESIGKLQHLVYLRVSVPVTNEQLGSIAKCRSLTEFELIQETPFQESQRNDGYQQVLSAVQGQIAGGVHTPQQNAALKETRKMIKGVVAAQSATPARVTDKGVIAFKDHPNLENLMVQGCDVISSTYVLSPSLLGTTGERHHRCDRSTLRVGNGKGLSLPPSAGSAEFPRKTPCLELNTNRSFPVSICATQ